MQLCVWWLASPIVILLIRPCGSNSSLDLLCSADPSWNPKQHDAAPGYISPLSTIAGFDDMRLWIVLPARWDQHSCCHRFQLRFNVDSFSSNSLGPGTFVPYLEWLPCGLTITHLACYGWVQEVAVSSGSWWITVQQCITNSTLHQEILTFSDSTSLAGAQSSQRKGPVAAAPIMLPNNMVDSLSALGDDWVCVLDGTHSSTSLGFSDLKSIEVDLHTSLSYTVVFSLPEPSNQEVFTLHFMTEGQRKALGLPRRFRCSNGTLEKVTSNGIFYNELTSLYQTLPLTSRNTWAGCSVSNEDGLPTFTCRGGHNFPLETHKVTTLYVGVSRCLSTWRNQPIKLEYNLRFISPRGPCRGYSMLLQDRGAKPAALSAGSHTDSISKCGPLHLALMLFGTLLSAYGL